MRIAGILRLEPKASQGRLDSLDSLKNIQTKRDTKYKLTHTTKNVPRSLFNH